MVEEKEVLLKKLKNISGSIYINGAGRYGDILGLWLEENKIEWLGYVDQSKSGQLNNKSIIKYVEMKRENTYFLISSLIYGDEMVQALLSEGIQLSQIICLNKTNVLTEISDDILMWKKYTYKNKKYQGYHKNDERCFIIGNGPSLKIEDLDNLQKEITFASNYIYTIYDKTDWRPTYYCAWDTILCSDLMNTKEKIKKILLESQAVFTSVLSSGFKFRDDDELYNLHYVCSSRKIDNNTELPCFSEDCSDIVYSSGTITYLMLQLAVYMGFKKIYLLGMDCSYSYEKYRDKIVRDLEKRNYIEEMRKEEEKYIHITKEAGLELVDIDQQLEGYRAAKKFADSHEIKIYNATRGGRLEVFERVDFDNIKKYR